LRGPGEKTHKGAEHLLRKTDLPKTRNYLDRRF